MADGTNIVWYPGHMAAAKRALIKEAALVDIVIELLDSRVPLSSRNPDIKKLFSHKPCLTLMTKSSLADDSKTAVFKKKLEADGRTVLVIDCKTGKNIGAVAPAIKVLLADKLERYAEKGMSGKKIRAMIVGVTNVGKSTFINTFTKTNKAKAEDRPGVTRTTQWITSPYGIELLDTPGLLWHKFDDPEVGIKLALTGAIRDEILDISFLAAELVKRLTIQYKLLFEERYKITVEENDTVEIIMEKTARRRGFLVSGGNPDEDRLFTCLLDEFRAGKIGKITLD